MRLNASRKALSTGGRWNGWGQAPAKRAFYRTFRDFNPLNDLGSGWKPRDAAVPGLALKQAWLRDQKFGAMAELHETKWYDTI